MNNFLYKLNSKQNPKTASSIEDNNDNLQYTKNNSNSVISKPNSLKFYLTSAHRLMQSNEIKRKLEQKLSQIQRQIDEKEFEKV